MDLPFEIDTEGTFPLIVTVMRDCVSLREKGRAENTSVSISWDSIYRRAHWLNNKRPRRVRRGLLATERNAT